MADAIGSDFETLSAHDLRSDQVPPWERTDRGTAYVETGRQALALIGATLHSRGRRRLAVPGYLCESMVEPFSGADWQIFALPFTHDLRYGTEARAALDSDLHDTVVLLASYFGRDPDLAHTQLAREARSRGALIVEDETHRVFRPGSEVADISFASLRKLLPVGDGAYIQGDDEVRELAERLPASRSARWTAMDAKRDTVDGSAATDFRSEFVRANEELERSVAPLAATKRTLETLRALPYEAMAAARRRNAEALRESLAHGDVHALPISGDEVPSHLVLIVPDPRALQRELAARGVYCAIHWPQISGVEGITSWRSDLLSVPIDHRYGREDMDRVAGLILEVMK